MSKYFTKYLPVAGEIKEGDLYFDGSLLNKKLSPEPWRIGKDWKRAELFLCSRDIQVGDNVQFQLTKHSPWQELKCIDTIPEQNTVILEGDEFTHHTSADGLNQCFKIIGEISPEAAKWVKEGDEFDEEEWRVINTTYQITLIKDVTKTFGHKTDFDPWIIQIKCPHCGIFT